MSNWNFFWGFLMGVLMAGILGFVLQQRRLAGVRKGAYRRPQKIELKTEKTPGKVVWSSCVACVEYYLWTMLLVAILLGAVFLLLIEVPSCEGYGCAADPLAVCAEITCLSLGGTSAQTGSPKARASVARAAR